MDDTKKLPPRFATREEWLAEAVREFRPWLEAAGAPLPELVRVSCGFPVGNRKAIGQCWEPETADDKTHSLFISPAIAAATGPYGVLGVLLHECCHAALPPKTGHKAAFKHLAMDTMGLGGKPTSTTVDAGNELEAKLDKLAKRLGPYPHSALSLSLKSKPGRKNPYIKVQCECGFICYATPKMLEDHSPMACPACGVAPWGTDETEED